MSEAVERKMRSEAILRAAGIQVNDHLPPIATADEVEIRSEDEIAPRAICLVIVAAKGFRLPAEVIAGLTEVHGVYPFFTPKEQAFIDEPSPSERDMLDFSWRAEAARPLFWALGFLDQLQLPFSESTADDLVNLIEQHKLAGLIANAKLRRTGDILDQADLIYRCHWATRQADLDNAPYLVEPGVTFERHHALNWLIGYGNQEWDHISTDT